MSPHVATTSSHRLWAARDTAAITLASLFSLSQMLPKPLAKKRSLGPKKRRRVRAWMGGGGGRGGGGGGGGRGGMGEGWGGGKGGDLVAEGDVGGDAPVAA